MDLIAEFSEAIAPLGADELFRTWGGVALTSCLLGRRVSTTIKGGLPLYPHIYVMLVAGSGYGKSTVIDRVVACLRPYTLAPVGNYNGHPPIILSPLKVTFPQIIRSLGYNFSEANQLAEGEGVRSVQCYALIHDEIGSLFGDKAHTGDLQDLSLIWDMKYEIAKQTVGDTQRGTNTRAIDYYCTALFGAQPKWIEGGLGLAVFELGTPARTHIVLPNARPPHVSPSQDDKDHDTLLIETLKSTMDRVALYAGRIKWSPEAWAAMVAWDGAGLPREDGSRDWPDMLEGYAHRRFEHAGKLGLIHAAARGHNIVEAEDFVAARNLLWTTELRLPSIAEMIGSNPYRHREDAIVDWVRAKGRVDEASLRVYMHRFIEARFITMTLEELLTSSRLKLVGPKVNPGQRTLEVSQ